VGAGQLAVEGHVISPPGIHPIGGHQLRVTGKGSDGDTRKDFRAQRQDGIWNEFNRAIEVGLLDKDPVDEPIRESCN